MFACVLFLVRLPQAAAQELPSELPSTRLFASSGLANSSIGAGAGVAGNRRWGPVGVHGSGQIFVGTHFRTNLRDVAPLVKLHLSVSWPFQMARRSGYFGPFLALDSISFGDEGRNCDSGYGCEYYESFTLGPVLTAIAPTAGIAWRWDDLGAHNAGVELGIGVQGYMIWDLGLIHPTLLVAYSLGDGWRFELAAERFAALLQIGHSL